MAHEIELQTGRFHNLARRILNIRGDRSLGPLGGIHAELDLLNAPLPDALHAGWRPYAIGVIVGGDATHPGQLSFGVPAGSEIMVQITRASARVQGGVGGGAPSFMSVRASTAAAAATGGTSNPVGVGRDTRIWRADGASNCSLVSTGHSADAFIGVSLGDVFPDRWHDAEPLAFFEPVHDESDGFIISPGQAVTFATQGVNMQIKMWLCWRERNIERGELQVTG